MFRATSSSDTEVPDGFIFDDNAYYRLLREMEERVRGQLGPQHPIYQAMHHGNMEMIRNYSSKRSREKLIEMFQPIKARLDEGQYNVEGGSLKFWEAMECFKLKYLEIQGLGPMKMTELDSFLETISYSSVEQLDARATEKEEELRKEIREKLIKLEKLFNEFKDKLKVWYDIRSDNVGWLYTKADFIDERKGGHNKAAIATAGVSLGAGAASIVIVSLILAPVTFGGSLALGLGVAASVVGVGASAVGIGNSVVERKFDMDAEKERLEHLDSDEAQWKDIKSIVEEIKELVEGFEPDFEETPGDDSEEESTGCGSGEYARRGASFVANVKMFFRSVSSMADELADAAKAGANAAKAIAGVAIGIGVVGMGMDIYTIAKTSLSEQAGRNKSERAKKLRKAADKLRDHGEKINEKAKGTDVEGKVEEALRKLIALNKRQL